MPLESFLDLDILPQPNDVTCGPTCLHALYWYYGEAFELDDVIAQVGQLEGGGTLAVFLACHALERGFDAEICTYNLQIFDPSWFHDGLVARPEALGAKLKAQLREKDSERIRISTEAYLEFLRLGGRLRFEDLTPNLLRRYLKRDVPILTGLSATYLYHCRREIEETNQYDDVKGTPAGHFVVLCGYNSDKRTVMVADPLYDNPAFRRHRYDVPIERLVGAILLGVLTYDANLLIVTRRRNRRGN